MDYQFKAALETTRPFRLAEEFSLHVDDVFALNPCMRRNLITCLGLLLAACRIQAQTNLQPVTLNTLRTFPELKFQSHWDARAKEIREQILVSSGLWPMPKKTSLRAEVFGRIEREDYTIEKVHFQPSPGLYLGGNLYRPRGKGKGPFPGVLIAHGHWKEGRLVDASDASKPGLGISFARQGIVAFAYDMVGYNDTRFADWVTNLPSPQDVHRMYGANRADELWGISLMGLQTWNTIRALDFLVSLPDVDKKGLGCTGASGGGTQTFMLGAIDDRLAVQAPVCMVSHSMQGGCSCENMPGLRIEFSNMEISAAVAPRPQILVAATGDWTRMTLEMEGPAIEKIYDLYGAKEKLRYALFDFGHNYNKTSREAVYEWFGKWLKPNNAGPFTERPFEKETDLRVFPDNKLPSDALTMAQFVEQQKKERREAWASLVPRRKNGFKKFKEAVEPLWRHTLQVTSTGMGAVITRQQHDVTISHASGSRELKGRFEAGAKGASNQTLVVMADSPATGVFTNRGLSVLKLENYSTAMRSNQFANYFSTYNRTFAQERVRDLVVASRVAQSLGSFPGGKNRVVLFGADSAGIWSLLAAPEADAVVADGMEFDTTNDQALLADGIFCPGIRNVGTFEGAAMLAAPHPLLLHNVGDKFRTDDIRAAYRALGATDKLRIESKRLSNEEIADWIARLE